MNSSNLITLVLGTRPEAIKLAPLIIKLKKNKKLKTRVIFTGQHIEMVSQVMQIFGLNCDKNLNLMKENQTLSYITNQVLKGLENEFNQFRPDLVLVQGDTSSAFAAALASFYNKIPVGHIEAGLRTNDLSNPFPEEGNRRLISQISSLHFAPTKLSKNNLVSSGVAGEIIVTGNTVIDSLLMISKKELNLPTKKINWNSQDVIFATLHRRENWGENTLKISDGLLKIIDHMPNTALLMPLHLNPKLRDPIKKILNNHPRIELVEPLDYQQTISCMKKAKLILTDSGGIQEEAPSLSKPVLVTRKTTERVEGIKEGTAKLIGTDSEKIFEEVINLLTNKKQYLSMANIKNPYGDGKASQKIVKTIERYLNI